MDNLPNILESILFYSGDAVDKSLIKEKLNITEKELTKAIKELEKKYDEESGIRLIKVKDKLQFATNSKYSECVDIVLKKTRERALSKTIIETVAIIAYKQPITRLEIEDIRGGAPADYAIRSLLEHKLIQVVGRKETLGRPLLFGTTDEFLKRFNLQDVNELPDFDQLMEEIKELNKPKENNQNLYKDYEIPEDEIKSEASLVETIKENEENIKRIQSFKLDENFIATQSNLTNQINEEKDIELKENNQNNSSNLNTNIDTQNEVDIKNILEENNIQINEDYIDNNEDTDFLNLSEIKEFKKQK